ncbi:MAG: ABC transporter permease subunit, partial [Coxiellaceae bacterium]|nr:ABC transporter permease subunit [Coxiellaceae bacterium]
RSHWNVIGLWTWNVLIFMAVAISLWFLLQFIFSSVSLSMALHVVYLGLITAIRVTTLIIISSIIWVPLGVLIGLSPRASQIVQPIAQFLAAFPANLLFPLVVIMIVKYQLNVDIWVSPLMILGTQWYILFNVVAGTMALPKNLRQAVGTLNVTGWLWWKRFILPGIFPYYITGAITAAGGAWNISIIAEAVSWGKTHLYATGLGAYISQVTDLGHFPEVALGITVMSLYVLVINRLLWKPLYNLAEKRFQIR